MLFEDQNYRQTTVDNAIRSRTTDRRPVPTLPAMALTHQNQQVVILISIERGIPENGRHNRDSRMGCGQIHDLTARCELSYGLLLGRRRCRVSSSYRWLEGDLPSTFKIAGWLFNKGSKGTG